MQLVRLQQAMTMYEQNHVDKVSARAYENLKAALNKIRSKTGM